MHRETITLSIRRKCWLLSINRSTLYYKKASESDLNIKLKESIKNIWLNHANKGSRTIKADLKEYDNIIVNRKRVQRIMCTLGIKGILPKRNMSKSGDLKYKHSYWLSGMFIYKANLVWATDLTYCKLPSGMMYIITLLDVYSRYVVSYAITNTLDTFNCLTCLDNGVSSYCAPIILNSDQGSQFTSKSWIDKLNQYDIIPSMDAKGRWADNIYLERYWRTLKYECIYMLGIETVYDLKIEVAKYVEYYNNKRLHSSLGYKTPSSAYFTSINLNQESLIYCKIEQPDDRVVIPKKIVKPSVMLR